ncbi:MAG: succinylglutamic semialdehyde dehydrogenase [Chlamydiales bacterium]|jgi:succinylglutamic semialdehyde dehydrogenase
MGSLYINGSWKKAHGKHSVSLNPANEKVLWNGESATKDDVDHAVMKASAAFESWSSLSLERRIAYLESFQKILTRRKSSLAETVSQEVGKPLWESLTEIQAMIGKIPISIEAFKDRCPESSFPVGRAHATTRHKAHGVVAVFGPFNFPAHLPNGHIIPALLAGNTVVFKPSELTPLVAEETIKIWEEVGLPPGVLNLIQGSVESGKALVDHPKVRGVFFTGSAKTGRSLSDKLGRSPEKILALELGGNNPLVVWDVADYAAAAYLTVQSAFITTGQRCTCARRLIISADSSGDSFIERLIETIHSIKLGPYTDKPEPFMGPIISAASATRLLEQQNTLQSRGGKSLIEMSLIKKHTALLSPGLIDVSDIQYLPDEEIFGPLLQVIRVKDFDTAIHVANDTAYGLSAGLLCDKKELFDQFYKYVRAGIINWNTQITGAVGKAPFGGVGISGNHRPSAYYAADYCSYPVASMVNETLSMPDIKTPGIS